MQIRDFVHLVIARYKDHETPTADGVPLDDLSVDRSRGGHVEIPPVVSKWRCLEDFDPDSQEHRDFLTSLLDDQLDRKATTSLGGEDAIAVLDILARVCVHSFMSADYKTTQISSVLILRPQVLDHGKQLGRLSNRTLAVLRSLAFNARQVPNHYKVDRSLGYDVDPVAFASGGFSDVRKGKLGGHVVAVKVLRMAEHSDILELQKVGYTELYFFFHTNQCTPDVAFLRGCTLEEHIPPQHPSPYRGRDR